MKKINGVGLTKDGIDLYSKKDFLGMHKAGRLAAQILDEIGEFVYPGQSTAEIDKIIEDKVNQFGAKSATIGYKGYEHCLLYTSPSPRDRTRSRMPSSA